MTTGVDDLPQSLPGELHLQNVFDLQSQCGAVIGSSFGSQLGPAADHVFVDSRGAFHIHPSA